MKAKAVTILSILILATSCLKAHTFSFQLIGRSIVFEATVNDTRGLFILDTGASNLILNDQFFQGWPTGEKMRGIAGQEVDVRRISVNLAIGDLDLKRTEALTLPLAHLSRRKGVPIMGLMGIRPLRNYALTIDFENALLEMIKADRHMDGGSDFQTPDISFHFSLKGGIPVIEMELGKKVLHFGFDTGATINVLDERIAGATSEHLKLDTEKRSRMIGVAGVSRSAQIGRLQQIIIENYLCPEISVVITSLAGLKGIGAKMNALDGFLGYDFMRHFRTTIHFKRRMIHLDQWDDSRAPIIVAR